MSFGLARHRRWLAIVGGMFAVCLVATAAGWTAWSSRSQERLDAAVTRFEREVGPIEAESADPVIPEGTRAPVSIDDLAQSLPDDFPPTIAKHGVRPRASWDGGDESSLRAELGPHRAVLEAFRRIRGTGVKVVATDRVGPQRALITLLHWVLSDARLAVREREYDTALGDVEGLLLSSRALANTSDGGQLVVALDYETVALDVMKALLEVPALPPDTILRVRELRPHTDFATGFRRRWASSLEKSLRAMLAIEDPPLRRTVLGPAQRDRLAATIETIVDRYRSSSTNHTPAAWRSFSPPEPVAGADEMLVGLLSCPNPVGDQVLLDRWEEIERAREDIDKSLASHSLSDR